MSLMQMFDKRCNISRYQEISRRLGTPEFGDVLVGKNIRCRLTRQTTDNTSEEGRVVIGEKYLLQLPKGTDVKNGDIIELAGKKYKTTEPYPLKYYIEVILTYEGEL